MSKPLSVLIKNQVSKSMGQINTGIEQYNSFKVSDSVRNYHPPCVLLFPWSRPKQGSKTYSMSNLNPDVEIE
ncbi:MAG: hypothetical protein WC981_02900 [Candidatus Dojkabacteria bacterium]